LKQKQAKFLRHWGL